MRFRTRARGGSGGGGGSPSLSLDFLNSVYSDTTSGAYASLADYLTASSGSFTRSGDNAWYFNSAGTLTQATANVPRFDYDPATLAFRGLLMEGERTNGIRNNSNMSAATVGTPGNTPTNWITTNASNGISRNVVGTGTEDGIPYIDIRFNGTASATAVLNIEFDARTAITAAPSEVWRFSHYSRLISGSLTGISALTYLFDANAAGTLTGGVSSASFTPTTGLLSGQRHSVSRTVSDVTAERIVGQWRFSITSGTVVDVTVRIGGAQIEKGATVSSLILTTGSARTRNADVFYIADDWLNATAGSLKATIRTATQTASFNFATLHNATDDDENIALRNNSSSIAALTVTDGGVSQADFTNHTAHPASTARTVFAAWAANDFALSSVGTVVTTDTSGTVPTGLTRLQIGNNRAGTAPFFGHVQKIEGYGSRLSNNQLQAGSAS